MENNIINECELTDKTDIEKNKTNNNIIEEQLPNSNLNEPLKLSINDMLPNQIYVRTVRFTIKVKDVPFINQTRIIKTQKLKKEGDKILYSTCTVSLDVPYCTYFTNEDIWEIIPKDNDKCIVR